VGSGIDPAIRKASRSVRLRTGHSDLPVFIG
jgi:hypothetical protein